METGKITLFLKLHADSVSSVTDNSMFKVISQNEIQLVIPPNNRRSFHFHKILMPNDSANEQLSASLTEQVLAGSNACALVLGDFPAGLSHAFGEVSVEAVKPGLVHSSMEKLFERVEEQKATSSFVVMASFMEIFEGKVRDLGLPYLNKDGLSEEEIRGIYSIQNLEVKDTHGKSYVEDVSLIQVGSVAEINEIMRKGLALRAGREGISEKAHTILSISVSQRPITSKETKKSRILFANVSMHEIPLLAFEETKQLDISSLRAVLNKINLVNHGVSFMSIPYKYSKLTHLLQAGLSGKSYVNIMAIANLDESTFDNIHLSLQYTKSLVEIDKKVKSTLLNNSDASETYQRIGGLEEEIEDLRDSFKKVQNYHEDRLKYLAKIVGIDEDLELMLNADRGSVEYNLAKKYREANKTIATLTTRSNQLEKKLLGNKNILEEIKLVHRNNQEKNERELLELENNIKMTKEELEDIREQQEVNAQEQAVSSTVNLEKLLLHSHLLLEEKSATLHTLGTKMTTYSNEVKTLTDNWENGKDEYVVHCRKEFLQRENTMRNSVKNLEDQYNYLTKAKDTQILKTMYTINQRGSERSTELSNVKDEGFRLYKSLVAQGRLIQEIQSGSFNNNIVPILIPLRDIPTAPTADKFPRIFQDAAQRSTELLAFSRSNRHSITMATSLAFSQKSERSFNRTLPALLSLRPPSATEPKADTEVDLEESLKNTRLTPLQARKYCSTLQNSIKVLQHRISELNRNAEKYDITGKQGLLETLSRENAHFKRNYIQQVQGRLSSPPAKCQKLDRHKLFVTELKSKPLINYSKVGLLHNRVPIVPKNKRQQLQTARPGDRFISQSLSSKQFIHASTGFRRDAIGSLKS